jgi:hypothetical protein
MLLFQFLDDSNDNYIELVEWMDLKGCIIKNTKISSETTKCESPLLKSPSKLSDDYRVKAEQLSALKKSESEISEYFDFDKTEDVKLAF